MSAKKKELTPEEMLQEALVPEEEQPYKVPENWVWVRLGVIYNLVKEDFDPSKNEQMPYIGLEHLAKGGGIIEVSNTDGLKSNKTLFAPGDVLYGKLRPYLNKHVCIDFKGVVSTDIIVLRSKGIFSNCLLDKYLNLPIVINYTVNNSKGINLPRVSPQAVLNMPVPVPPLYEQKRIVSRVESLLDKINQAKELIAEARETFNDRRSAILAKAFRGELTKKWREQNPDIEPAEKLLERIREEKTKLGIKQVKSLPVEPPYELPKNWTWARLNSCVIRLQYGYTQSSSIEKIGPKFLRITDIQDNEVEWISVPYCQINDTEFKKYKLYNNDIVVARTGATTGKSFLLKDPPKAVFASYLIRLSPSQYINARYLYFYINSIYYWEQIMIVSKGIAQPGVNASVLGSLVLPLPPLHEQEKIVIVLEPLLMKLKNISYKLEKLLRDKDMLDTAILTKTFRGQLGTNDPAEESALQLLKEFIAYNPSKKTKKAAK